MANITNEQRSGLIRIIEDNGRGREFFEKYGKPVKEANRADAQKLVDQLTVLGQEQDTRYSVNRAEEQKIQNENYKKRNELDAEYNKALEELRVKNEKANNERSRTMRTLEKKLKALGFVKDADYEGDTTVTNAEYEMFKKRALAGVWGAETLENANIAIQKYLNLEK
jgi:hypothetical protein